MRKRFLNTVLNAAARVDARQAVLYTAVFLFFFFMTFYKRPLTRTHTDIRAV